MALLALRSMRSTKLTHNDGKARALSGTLREKIIRYSKGERDLFHLGLGVELSGIVADSLIQAL